MKKAVWLFTGFLLFVIGFSALVLSFVGVQFSFLGWMEIVGKLPAFLLKLSMVIAGIIIVYLTATDWRTQDD